MPVHDVLRQRMQPLASVINSHRILFYSFLSTLAVSAAIANALKNHSNFYSVAIYLSKSSRSVLVLANFGFLVAILYGRVVQQIFFGALRPTEIERLYDRLWFFVTESLLAFTIFRDEFDIPFALMFGFLLFIKSFHWLASDRIEWMDQRPYPGPPTLFHIRINALFVVLWAIDFIMLLFAIESTLMHGVGGMVLFASEYAILMASALNTMAKYTLSVLEIRRARLRGGENAPPWENKSMWVFYIELTTDFLKLTTYLIFFTVIITFYGLPLNIVRDVYITARSFITRLRALHRYQTATRNMDQRYPDATVEEMSALSDRTCIICREEMVLRGPEEGERQGQGQANTSDGPNTTPKKLPCGHIFHFHCLRSWLERQQSCPTCRRTVLDPTPPVPAAGVRPAQPGGVLEPPNGIGAPPPVQQPIIQQQNNPFGFLGRFLGFAAQPPIIPGQFVHVPPGEIGQLPHHLDNIPGHQQARVVINIQYQVPRAPQPQPVAHPPQAMQPPPHFPGFQGPGGVWQPWGMDNQWFEQERRNPEPSQSTATSRPPAQPTQTSAPAPHPLTSADTPPSSPQQSQSQPTVAALQQNDKPSTPREAAAQAALRRFGSAASLSPQAPSREASSSATDGLPHDTSHVPADESNLPSTSFVSSSPQSQSGVISEPRGQSREPDTFEVPAIIPLYDLGSSSRLPRPPGASEFSPTSSSHEATPSPFPNHPASPRTHLHPPSGPSQRHSGTPLMDPSLTNADTHSRTPSQLPPNLTEEQLATMDRVTREAIDERLRVLEGVSIAVFRCIDDLIRMRSALPTPAPRSAVSERDPATASRTNQPSSSAEAVPGTGNGASEILLEPSADHAKSHASTAIDISDSSEASTSQHNYGLSSASQGDRSSTVSEHQNGQ